MLPLQSLRTNCRQAELVSIEANRSAIQANWTQRLLLCFNDSLGLVSLKSTWQFNMKRRLQNRGLQLNGSKLFRPMSCSPGVVSPGPRVDSPGVWSPLARELRISLFLLEISENHKNQVKFKIFSDRWMDGWMIELQQSLLSNKSRWSICKTKVVACGWIKMATSYSGRNDFRLWAKRLQTPGELTLGPCKTTPGEQDIGRNDRKSS